MTWKLALRCAVGETSYKHVDTYRLFVSPIEGREGYSGLSNTPDACDFAREMSALTQHKYAGRSHVFPSLRRFRKSRIRWPDAVVSRP